MRDRRRRHRRAPEGGPGVRRYRADALRQRLWKPRLGRVRAGRMTNEQTTWRSGWVEERIRDVSRQSRKRGARLSEGTSGASNLARTHLERCVFRSSSGPVVRCSTAAVFVEELGLVRGSERRDAVGSVPRLQRRIARKFGRRLLLRRCRGDRGSEVWRNGVVRAKPDEQGETQGHSSE